MSNPAIFGYLEDPLGYAEGPYLTGTALMSYGLQATLVIVASLSIGDQAEATINKQDPIGVQATLVIHAQDAIGSQALLDIAASKPIGSQATAHINNHPDPIGSESTLDIHAQTAKGMQARLIIAPDKAIGMQVFGHDNQGHATGIQSNLIISDGHRAFGSEFRHDNFASWCIGGYLVEPYLTYPYLTCIEAAQFGAQANFIVHDRRTPYGSQADVTIHAKKAIGSQARLIIEATKAYGMQFTGLRADIIGCQTTFVLYNATNLRILDKFPSRGLNGLSWTASSTASGDFGANNLNTDIVEQQWRSAPSVIAGILLTCDTQVSSVVIDTMAILNHNLTTSAVVVVEGSNSPSFSPIGETFPINVLKNNANAYYIAQFLPMAGFRYWRIHIDDPTNPEGQIKIGTILFGPSIIFQGDNITDNVVRTLVHFADKVSTEGYTDVMNDRALKYGVKLEFKNLNYQKGNYQQLDQVFQFARTSLKCLWIPDPRIPERFAVYAKMKQIPDSMHNVKGRDIDFVDLSIDLDESL